MAGEFEERAECWTRGKDLAQTIEAIGFSVVVLRSESLWVDPDATDRTWHRLHEELVPQARGQLMAAESCGVRPDTLKELTTTLNEVEGAVDKKDLVLLATESNRFRSTLAGAIP